MTEYFLEDFFHKAQKQRKIVLGWYIAITVAYVIFGVGMFLWYRTFIYQDDRIGLAKFIHYSVTALFVIFSFVYFSQLYLKLILINFYFNKLFFNHKAILYQQLY